MYKLKNIRLALIITSILLFYNIFGINEQRIKDEQNLKDFYGFWSPTFPVPPAIGAFGYVFNDDGKFYYYNMIDSTYYNSGAMGKWKIDKNKILLFIQYHATWKKKWDSDKFGLAGAGVDNQVVLEKVKSPKWEIVGNFNSLVVAEDAPTTILLKKIDNKRLSREMVTHFSLAGYQKSECIGDCDDLHRVIKFFEDLK